MLLFDNSVQALDVLWTELLILTLSTSNILKFNMVTVKILDNANIVASSLITISQPHIRLGLRRNL